MSRTRTYPVRRPRFAAGIRAQLRTDSLADRSWWSREWMRVLEKMGLAGRLGRGRNYAVSGQVTELVLEGPHVEAKVQGTRDEPYTVTLDFRTPDEAARARIVAKLRAEPIIAARILADDLPTEVEEAFRAEGFTLFPGGKIAPRVYDMTSKCSCPDWSNPCKHTSAVLLILGEEVSRRPATLLELRGITVEELYED